jgi:hypothetical protein
VLQSESTWIEYLGYTDFDVLMRCRTTSRLLLDVCSSRQAETYLPDMWTVHLEITAAVGIIDALASRSYGCSDRERSQNHPANLIYKMIDEGVRTSKLNWERVTEPSDQQL